MTSMTKRKAFVGADAPRALRILLVALLLWIPLALAQGGLAALGGHSSVYTGRFRAVVPGGKLSLALEQRDAKVSGRLDGLGGASFQLEGELQSDGKIIGVARTRDGGLYFIGQRHGTELQMAFAEPDASMKPDMANARKIVFVADDGSHPATGTAAPGGTPSRPGPAASAGEEHLLQGCFMSYKGSGGYGGSYGSTTRTSVFDGRGQFVYRSETYSSGSAGTAVGGSGGQPGRYRVQGNQISYQLNGGDSGTAVVLERAANGAIMSFKTDGNYLFGRGC